MSRAKAVITLTDGPGGMVNVSCELTPPINMKKRKKKESPAQHAALDMLTMFAKKKGADFDVVGDAEDS